jgi:hypothetical protein
MEALLIQRAKGVISDVDKASLYLKLQEYNKNR